MRALLAALVPGLVAAVLLPVPGAAAAQDGSGYRYWSFWEQDADSGTWQYATQGPGSLRPADGAVLGFRFAVSVDSADADPPRESADFGTVCPEAADATNGSGSGHVALVLDFGTAGDAPDGERPPHDTPRAECAELADGATAAELLAEVAPPLRYDVHALLCAIAGYPERGCGEQVSTGDGDDSAGTAGEKSEEDERGQHNAQDEEGSASGAGTLTTLAGAAAVALLAAAAVWRARQRRP